MTTTTKTKRGRFTPWCWEAERDEYNDESRRGWHLAKRTFRDMTYEYAPEKQYRYAIDYRVQHNEAQYLELFEADGWELVGTVTERFNASQPAEYKYESRFEGCWYIFRKEYDPGRPDTEYEIATDEASIRELKNTLTQKYRRALFFEVMFLLYWLTGIYTGGRPYSIILLIMTGLEIISSTYHLLCVTVLRPRKTMRGLFTYTRWLTLILWIIALILCTASLFSACHTEKENTIPLTAENTPVQLFLDLRPDITVDEVMLLAEEYNLDATAFHNSCIIDGETIYRGYTITLIPDIGMSISSYYYDGVTLSMTYNADATILQSAFLNAYTDDGRAYCHYFPVEPTAEDCETGYNLFLRKSAIAPQRYYHADTPEEIIAIAYPVLYPDGLE